MAELDMTRLSEYMGKENIKEDIWTGGIARNMENRK
jgi:hypothetical protein